MNELVEYKATGRVYYTVEIKKDFLLVTNAKGFVSNVQMIGCSNMFQMHVPFRGILSKTYRSLAFVSN